MKIVVIGGLGLIGSKVVRKLRSRGYEVIAADVRGGENTVTVNTITGEGLSAAFEGAQKVVDVANSPSFEDDAAMEFFETSGRNLLAAEKAAGVKHHIALSVVGTERLPDSGYLRAKAAQEKLIKKSQIPYTILHSTQFFEFAGAIVKGGTTGDTIHLPSALFQPIASDDVVDALADVIVADPKNSTVEVGGPEKIGMDKFAKKYMDMKHDNRKIISDPHARYYGTEIDDHSLTAADNARKGTIRYDEWIRQPGNLR